MDIAGDGRDDEHFHFNKTLLLQAEKDALSPDMADIQYIKDFVFVLSCLSKYEVIQEVLL